MFLYTIQFDLQVLTEEIQVFRKFSYSLGPDVSELLEDILKCHEIADEDVESSLETLAIEYSKQDGKRDDFLKTPDL